MCCPTIRHSIPPSVPAPPPPPTSAARVYANIPSLFSTPLNKSWANLIHPIADSIRRGEGEQSFKELDCDEADWLMELTSPPPLPSSVPPLNQGTDTKPSTTNNQSALVGLQTYISILINLIIWFLLLAAATPSLPHLSMKFCHSSSSRDPLQEELLNLSVNVV